MNTDKLQIPLSERQRAYISRMIQFEARPADFPLGRWRGFKLADAYWVTPVELELIEQSTGLRISRMMPEFDDA